MKTLKTTITIEFEDTLDYNEYLMVHPDRTEEDAKADLEEFVLLEDIGHVAWAAENRLPGNMKLTHHFKWENKNEDKA